MKNMAYMALIFIFQMAPRQRSFAQDPGEAAEVPRLQLRQPARDHVEPPREPEAELGLRLGFSNIQTHFEGDFAWAVVDTESRLTTADGGDIHN